MRLKNKLSDTIRRLDTALARGQIALAEGIGRKLDPLLDLQAAVPDTQIRDVPVLTAEQIILKHNLTKPDFERLTSEVLRSGVSSALIKWPVEDARRDILQLLIAEES